MMELPAANLEPQTLYSWTRRQVTISRAFYLGKYELTRSQWESVMGKRADWPEPDDPNCPATLISWDDAQEYIHRLNQVAGDSLFRLPTANEWGYACRAGTQTWWFFGVDGGRLKDYGWTGESACNWGECFLHTVGTKLPNPWGLFDMYGNAWEWCQDQGGTDNSVVERIIRGGNYGNLGVDSEYRDLMNQTASNKAVGLRLVRMRPPDTMISPRGWGLIKEESW